MSNAECSLSRATRRDVETFVDDWRVEAEIPGASVALVDADDRVYAAGFGMRDVDARAPATPGTRYPFASVTKVVTAVVVLALVAADDLALDDEVGEYVDHWTAVPGDPITVADLLAHTSGVPDDEGGPRNYLFSETPPASPIATAADRRRHLDSVGARRVVDEDRFMYGDENYTTLGEVVEAVDGRPFDEVAEALVFEPLAMDSSTVGYGALDDVECASRGYAVEDGVPAASEFDLDADATGLGPASAGGLLASVTDVARLVRCLLNDGALDGARVLPEALVAAMCRHQAPTLEHVDGTERGCGYGPRVTEFVGDRFVEHSGTAPGVGRAYLGFWPARELGVALAVNASGVPVPALGQGVLALAVGENPTSAVPYLALRAKVRAVAGTYESHRGNTVVEVEPSDSEAYVEATNVSGAGWSFPAFPETMARDDHRFRTVWPAGLEQPLDFHETENGMELRLASHRLRRTNVPR